MTYRRDEVIFGRGDPCKHLLYIQSGGVRLSVRSSSGREAVVAILAPGEFFGEGSLAGQPVRIGSATAVEDSAIGIVEKDSMMEALHTHAEVWNQFIAHMFARNLEIEEQLIDQLFNVTEKRLARTLLLLAGSRDDDTADCVVPNISQQRLAEMVGSTRSCIGRSFQKFKSLGFIECRRRSPIRVNRSLRALVLH
ncbi:MAG: Crp/Fnr family transcriptional regulator [Acidobacteriota bacterium]